MAPAAAAAAPHVEAAASSPGRHAARSGLEHRVATLAEALALDAKQRGELRAVLERYREGIQRIGRDGALRGADRVAMTKALSKRTADEIRALLNEEQRKKLGPPPQGDAGNAARSAQVERWMPNGVMR